MYHPLKKIITKVPTKVMTSERKDEVFIKLVAKVVTNEKKEEIFDKKSEKKSVNKAEIEMANVELDFEADESVKGFGYSRKSALSADRVDGFSVHSEDIPDEAGDEFFFEQDNNNSLIEKIEEKIQSDILKEENKRQKKEMETFFKTVKLNEFDRRSHKETIRTVDNEMLKRVSEIGVKCHRSEDVKIIGGNDNKDTNNQNVNENYEIEDMNDLMENYNDDNENDSRSNLQSEESKKVNKTDECSIHTVTKKMGFEVII